MALAVCQKQLFKGHWRIGPVTVRLSGALEGQPALLSQALAQLYLLPPLPCSLRR